MNRRLPILALAAVLVVAVAVPAFARPAKVAPKLDRKSAIRALAKARLALLTARSAKSQSRVALRTANAAVNTANDAKGIATTTQASLDSTKIQSSLATGTVTTEEEKYVSLAGGPSVTVTVPSSGFIEVWSQVTIEEDGAVGLFEDGQLMAGQAEFCGAAAGVALLSLQGGPPGEPLTLATPAAPGFPGCGVLGPPGAVLFQTTPGTHTYELRYQSCGCAPEAIFSQRLLRVAPRL